MIKIVVFDFDDTLVKSEHIKQSGFSEIFTPIAGAKEIAQDFAGKHYGKPRHEMIKGIIARLQDERIVNWRDAESKTKQYVNAFREYTEQEVVRAEVVPSVVQILKHLSDNYILYLNSATPQESILKIIKARKWNHFFKAVYGSPPGTKAEHLSKIIKDEKANPGEVVVIGDGMSDLKAAKECGCQFIGMRGEFSDFSLKEDVVVVNDLADIIKLILHNKH